MKMYFLLVILFFIVNPAYTQHRLDSLTVERSKVYVKYKEHNDTMTVNTWLNIFKLNKYLQKIVFYDSLINSEILKNQMNRSDDLAVAQSKLDNLINEKKDMNRRLSEAESVHEYSGKNLRISIITGCAVTALLVVFLVLYILSYNKVKKSNLLVKKYHTDLYSAKAEIEQLQKDQMDMAAQINSRVKEFDDEIKKVNDKMSLLSDEKVMLENQMIEIKKAYDREVERRMTAEDKLQLLETSGNYPLQQDVSNIMTDESNPLAKNIQLLKTELENEKSIRLSIENELNKLLIRLREHYS